MFREGDKVTQLRNNYEKGTAGVFNGTVGIVTALSTEEQTLTVRTDEDESIDCNEFDELDELAHAYSITIHRSQGSEYPAVVIPLTTSGLDDAPAEPAVHRGHESQEAGGPGRIAQGAGRCGPHRQCRPAGIPPWTHRLHPGTGIGPRPD